MTKYPIVKYYAPVEVVEGGSFKIFLRSLYAGGRPMGTRAEIAREFNKYNDLKQKGIGREVDIRI